MRTRKIRQVLGVIAVASLLLALFVVQAVGEIKPGTTITWIAHPVHYDITGRGELLKRFEEKTGIKVVPVLYPNDVIREKVMMELAAKSGRYDVITMNGSHYRTDLGTNVFVDLGPRMHEVEDVEDFSQGFFDLFRPGDGSIVALPLRTGADGLLYREDLLQQAGLDVPETIDEFVHAAQKLTMDTNSDGINDVYGVGFVLREQIELAVYWESWLQSFGGTFFNETLTRGLVSSPAGVEATQFITDLVHKYKVTPPGIFTHIGADLQNLMFQGKLAMAPWWWQYITFFDDPAKSKVVGKVKITFLPQKPGVGLGYGYGGGWALFIDKNSANIDAAWEFIKYLTSYEAQVYEMQHGNGPSRVSVFNHPSFEEKYGRDGAAVIAEMYKRIRLYPTFRGVIESRDVIARELSLAFTQQKTAKEAMQDAEEEINQIMKESGRM